MMQNTSTLRGTSSRQRKDLLPGPALVTLSLIIAFILSVLYVFLS